MSDTGHGVLDSPEDRGGPRRVVRPATERTATVGRLPGRSGTPTPRRSAVRVLGPSAAAPADRPPREELPTRGEEDPARRDGDGIVARLGAALRGHTVVIGIVTVATGQEAHVRRFRATRLVPRALLVVFVIHLLRGITGASGPSAPGALVAALLTLVVTLFVLALFATIMLNAVGIRTGFPMTLLTRIFRGVLRLTGRGVVAGVRAGGAAAGRRRPLTEHQVQVRRFRLRVVDDGDADAPGASRAETEVACVMPGELDGADVRHGDLVRVHGRTGLNRVVRVGLVEILGRGGRPTSQLRPRLDPAFRGAKAVDYAARAVLVLLVAHVALLLV